MEQKLWLLAKKNVIVKWILAIGTFLWILVLLIVSVCLRKGHIF